MTEAADRLLVDEDRDPQSCALDRYALDGIHQCRTFSRPQASGCANARDLADTMRHPRSHKVCIEGVAGDQRRTPQTPELRELLIQGHSAEQIFNSFLEGQGRIRKAGLRGGHW